MHLVNNTPCKTEPLYHAIRFAMQHGWTDVHVRRRLTVVNTTKALVGWGGEELEYWRGAPVAGAFDPFRNVLFLPRRLAVMQMPERLSAKGVWVLMCHLDAALACVERDDNEMVADEPGYTDANRPLVKDTKPFDVLRSPVGRKWWADRARYRHTWY